MGGGGVGCPQQVTEGPVLPYNAILLPHTGHQGTRAQ